MYRTLSSLSNKQPQLLRLYDRKSLIFLSFADGEYACTKYQCFARFYYFIRTDNHSSKTNPKLIHPETFHWVFRFKTNTM